MDIFYKDRFFKTALKQSVDPKKRRFALSKRLYSQKPVMRYLFTLLLLCFATLVSAIDKAALFSEIESLAAAGSPEAQYHLGMFYNNGIGTDKNPNEAFKWFRLSARSGDPLGSYKLGCYYAGQGQGVVENNKGKALKYKLIAAESGYSYAQYDVAGIYYRNGEIEEAIKWWKEASAQGYLGAMYALFTLYNQGEQIPKDGVLSYGYLKIIERNASKDQIAKIAAKLTELENELTDVELKRAQRFASDWTPHKTPMTEKALNGLEEASLLVKSAY